MLKQRWNSEINWNNVTVVWNNFVNKTTVTPPTMSNLEGIFVFSLWTTPTVSMYNLWTREAHLSRMQSHASLERSQTPNDQKQIVNWLYRSTVVVVTSWGPFLHVWNIKQKRYVQFRLKYHQWLHQWLKWPWMMYARLRFWSPVFFYGSFLRHRAPAKDWQLVLSQ